MVRLLHISDLHARKGWSNDQAKIARAMLEDVASLQQEHPVDLAVFSGDLGFEGKKGDFDLARQILLEPLMERLSLSSDRVVLVPGNHDVDRSAVNEYLESGYRARLTSRATVNELLEDAADVADATKRLKAWEKFRSSFYEGSPPAEAGRLARVHRFQIDGESVGVAALNSAWRCSGDDDLHRVLVGARQLEDALASIEHDSLRIVVVHHPLSWLATFDAKGMRSEVERHADLVLSGHEHEAEPEAVTSAQGSAVFAHAGCLYETHEYPNGYSLIDVDLEQRRIEMALRTWWPDRGVFDAAVDRASDGKIAFEMRAGPGIPAAPPPSAPPPSAAPRKREAKQRPEVRYAVLVVACARLADGLVSASATRGEKSRTIALVRRELPGLIEDEVTVGPLLEAVCPGAMPIVARLLHRSLENYLQAMSTVISWREAGQQAPEEVEYERKRAREPFVADHVELEERLKTARLLRGPLGEQEEIGVWRAFGFSSRDGLREQLEPSMRSLDRSPGEFGELVLEKLLDGPVSPEKLGREGIPEARALDLLNRVLASEWARWDADEIVLTDLGAQLVRRRLSEWRSAS